MIRRRSFTRAARRAWSALAMLAAIFMLASAPAIASVPEAGMPSPGIHSAHESDEACAEAVARHTGLHDGAMPAHCLASCLAAMAVTSPAVPFVSLARPVLQALPEARAIGALVPHPLPVDPPPPRFS